MIPDAVKLSNLLYQLILNDSCKCKKVISYQKTTFQVNQCSKLYIIPFVIRWGLTICFFEYLRKITL